MMRTWRAALLKLMQSDLGRPANSGSPEHVSLKEFVETVAQVASKNIKNVYIGLKSRKFSSENAYSLDWQSRFALRDGIEQAYWWILEQAHNTREAS